MTDDRRPSSIAETQSETSIAQIVLLVLTLLATLALVVSCIPFETVAHRARLLSASGHANFFTADFYRSVQFRLRLIATVDILLAALALALRRTIRQIA